MEMSETKNSSFSSTDAPILRLYPDIWACIAEYLNLSSLVKLLELGDARLPGNRIRRVCHDNFGPVINMKAVLRTCSHFPALQELAVLPIPGRTFLRLHTSPLVFPPTLTSLSLSFNCALGLVTPLKLSTMVPILRHLSIKDQEYDMEPKIEELDLPPLLESLSLRISRAFPQLSKTWFALLPRTLKRLLLRTEDFPNFHSFESYDWPPSLEYLNLSSRAISLEHLPRTVFELDLSGLSSFSTAFGPGAWGQMIFPWRRFFPRLHTLTLPNEQSMYWNMLLDTITLDSMLDSAAVDDFIASGFWNVPHLLPPPSTPYPVYRAIELPYWFWSLNVQDVMTVIERAAPQLKTTKMVKVVAPISIVSLLPSTTMFASDYANLVQADANIPEQITHFECYGSVNLSALPPRMLEIKCDDIRGSGAEGEIVPGDAFPAALTSLTLNVNNGRHLALTMLPLTLTRLFVWLGAPEEWNVMAERLVNLKTLKIVLRPSWSVTEPLSLISSTSLEFVTLSRTPRTLPDTEPLFSGLLSTTRNVFPPSLRALDLTETAIHASTLAVVPRSLTKLYVNGLVWATSASENRHPPQVHPETKGLSNADIVKRLPPKLLSLELFGSWDPTWSRASKKCQPSAEEVIQFVPPSITSLTCDNVLSIEDVTKEQIIPLLPSKLAFYNIETLRIKAKDIRPSGFYN